jgi:hypothetical protein
MGMLEKAKEELKLLRGNNSEPDEMQDHIEKGILEIVEIFSKQGHSGSSAAYAIAILEKLLRQENITPLTGEEWEWVEVGKDIFQNKRCSSVFKDKTRFNGNPYWLDGKIFSYDGEKSWFTNGDSCVEISFPWNMPESEKIIINKE